MIKKKDENAQNSNCALIEIRRRTYLHAAVIDTFEICWYRRASAAAQRTEPNK